MAKEIKLGDTVRCKHTGFQGVAVARTEFINGCIQFSVAPKWKKGTDMLAEIGIDETSLEIVKRQKTTSKKPKSTGGKPTRNIKMRGY